jgi:ketosteroid isomerase-like protein
MTINKNGKTLEESRLEVFASERAFAKSMADRDIDAFAFWVSEEAIFFTTSPPLRGKHAIVEYWSRFYESQDAPFSWGPEMVEVISSGSLALSSGPVKDPSGNIVANFNSIWRQESPDQWKVIFDKGSSVTA